MCWRLAERKDQPCGGREEERVGEMLVSGEIPWAEM
jgi:hypothetical protein